MPAHYDLCAITLEQTCVRQQAVHEATHRVQIRAEVDGAAAHTVYNLAESWYNGKNIDGKKGGFMIYVGGFPRYCELSSNAVKNGYQGFVRQ